MQDSSKSGHYFLKSKVRASYTSEVYDVTATLSQHSGFVRDASCTCRASAMGRCRHVTGLLYALLDYIDTCDTLKVDPQSCTSLPCAWNQGRKSNKLPKKVQKSVYPSAKKRKVHDIINYDHTSTLNKQREQFIQNLKVKSESNFPVELVKSKVLLPGLMNVHVSLTASTCKDVVSLKSDRAIMNFLNRHLWKTDPISAPALQYGIKHEK